MQFIMNESGLHYFDSRDQEFTFVNTVSDNKEGFTERQIKGTDVARDVYATLIYPSAKYYKTGSNPRCPLFTKRNLI